MVVGETIRCPWHHEVDRLIHPLVTDSEFDPEHVNVDAQQRDSNSALSWTEHVPRVRRNDPQFGARANFWRQAIAVFSRIAACTITGECSFSHNLSKREAVADLNLPDIETLEDLLTRKPHKISEGGQHRLKLEPCGYWFEEKRSANP